MRFGGCNFSSGVMSAHFHSRDTISSIRLLLKIAFTGATSATMRISRYLGWRYLLLAGGMYRPLTVG